MALRIVHGPPASGKTHLAATQAREAASGGERVWWIAAGTLRSTVLRRLTEAGPVLGVEVLTWQQLCYRLLSDARRLKPLLTGSGRLATVGEALREVRGHPPMPGEARLFASAIAEAKAFQVAVGAIPGDGIEAARLRRVAHEYERRKGEAWDYDDFRTEAATMLEAGPPNELVALLPDRIVIDGVPELTPADRRLVEAVASVVPTEAFLALLPEGWTADQVLPPRAASQRCTYRFPNPVHESRWVLRDVKRMLAEGAHPLDLALIVPPGRARAVTALAAEYGVPLMDETPRGLADLPEGRRLVDLLDLADAPSAARLLGVPALRDLGAAAMRAGVAGRDAIARLAAERGEAATWDRWMTRLKPGHDPLAWGAQLVRDAWTAVHGPIDAEAGEEPSALAEFRDQALQRLAEARRVAHGDGEGQHLRRWWIALLQESAELQAPPSGVALLHAPQALGRHVRHAWILGANEGAHLPRAREDYFVPEELRSATPHPKVAMLPARFGGARERHAEALLARGDITTITFSDGDQGGRTPSDPALIVGEAVTAPELPAGSPLDLAQGERYLAPEGTVDLGVPDVASLARFAECGLRTWAERHLPSSHDAASAWRSLRRNLSERSTWTPTDLRALGDDHPSFATWLDHHADELARFTYGVHLRDPGTGLSAFLHAAQREANEAHLVHFTEPGRIDDEDAANEARDRRPELGWAVAHLLTRHRRTITTVHVRIWPLGGEPIEAPAGGITYLWKRFVKLHQGVHDALPDWRAGAVHATPGFACRDCRAFDVCRMGTR